MILTDTTVFLESNNNYLLNIYYSQTCYKFKLYKLYKQISTEYIDI